MSDLVGNPGQVFSRRGSYDVVHQPTRIVPTPLKYFNENLISKTVYVFCIWPKTCSVFLISAVKGRQNCIDLAHADLLHCGSNMLKMIFSQCSFYLTLGKVRVTAIFTRFSYFS